MSGEIILDGLQIKSFKKAQRLAYALNIIEEECGIREVNIMFKNTFLCPWIDMEKLKKTDMERLIRGILTKWKYGE